VAERLNGNHLYSSAGIIAEPSEYRFDGMTKQEMAESRYFVERPRLRLRDPKCAGKDSSKWQPNPRQVFENAIINNREALEICYSCPDRVQCLQYALEYEETGVWGGIVEGSRRGVDAASAEWLIADDLRRRQELDLD